MYDGKDEHGNPAGGGWTMFKGFVREGRLAETVNANPALRNVARVSWTLLSGASRHADISEIPDKPEVVECLLRVCYLNTGKMPAATTTKHSLCWNDSQSLSSSLSVTSELNLSPG